MKRLAAILLTLCLLLPAVSLGEGYGVFLLDMDALDLSRARDAEYIASALSGDAQGLRVTKWLGDESQRVRLIVMRQDGSLLLDKAYESVSGQFDSGDIYFTASDTLDMRYEITLLVGVTVYQLPFYRAPGRLRDNTACSYGLRFQDGNGSLTDTYMMGTLLSLSALEQAGGTTQISLCASNRYLIGYLEVNLYGGSLTVSAFFYDEANVSVKHSYAFIITNVSALSSIEPGRIGLPAYPLDTPIDVGGLDLIMLYVPMMLDYDPAALSTFSYDLWGDSQLQNQLAMWDMCWNQ